MDRSLTSPAHITVVCHHCGYLTDSMLDAMRHDADRPRSCRSWLERLEMALLPIPLEQVDQVLRGLVVQGEGSLDGALDEYHGKIRKAYTGSGRERA
jgi:hypothetical protein